MLFVLISIFSIACGHLPKQGESISKQEVQQVTRTLKEIASKLQNYHEANHKWPTQFTDLTMKNPSTKKWDYYFLCKDDNPTNDACDIFANTPQLYNTNFHITLQLSFISKKQENFAQNIALILYEHIDVPCFQIDGDTFCADDTFVKCEVHEKDPKYYICEPSYSINEKFLAPYGSSIPAKITPAFCQKFGGYAEPDKDFCILEEKK